MRARFHDGRTATPWSVEVAVEAGALVFEADGQTRRWPADGLSVERGGDYVRVSHRTSPDARLTLDPADWARAGLDVRGGRGHVALVLGLTAAAAALGLFVFVGMPALSGPLARATPPAYEARIGKSFETQLGWAFPRCEGKAGQAALHKLGATLRRGADSPFAFDVRAVRSGKPNAFALPGGTILITDEMIELAKTPDELAAVVAHEAAHVELRHSMQSVWRALGFGLVLDAVVGGGTGAGQQAVLLAGAATDLGHSRAAESAADARGRELLHAAGLSSKGMAPMFERLAKWSGGPDDERLRGVLEVAQSHPDTRGRAALARKEARPGRPALTAEEWTAVRTACVKPEKRAKS